MSGARYVDQRDVDSSLATPAVPLNADDEFVIASDHDDVTPYLINLPDVREVEGKDIIIKARIVPPIVVAVTIGTVAGQTIDGVAGPIALGAAGNTVVFRADPPDTTVTPTAAPTNWSVIRGPSPP